jgi:two-component system, sensor histidine kinase YesM
MCKTLLFFSLAFLLTTNYVAGQDTLYNKGTASKKKLSEKAEDLERSIKSKENPIETARNYEKIAFEFSSKNNKVKAIEYFEKAKTIYEKINDKKELSRVIREIAKLQESQQQYDDAIQNYEQAGNIATTPSTSSVNSNDAKRLKSSSSSTRQGQYLDANIQAFEKEGDIEEVTSAIIKKAENQLTENNTKEAIINYERAIEVAGKTSPKASEIRNEIANVYVKQNDLSKAIQVKQEVLEELDKNDNVEQQIAQRNAIGELYLNINEQEKALIYFKEAYQLAVDKGKTIEARNALNQLVQFYSNQNNGTQTLHLYRDFTEQLDEILQKDSSLIDQKIFQATEEKIKQLEIEQGLKDELIVETNRFNTILIIALIGLFVLLFFIVKSLKSIQIKNKKIALQSLRREMNPHFIFNSLNSVNQFISQNDELKANKYLTSYSTLMRNMMETSTTDFISLGNEIEQLKKYLQLEHLRFEDKFDFKIEYDETIDLDKLMIPNMLIQPNIENAIWHGLRYRETKGLLTLSFVLQHDKLVIQIIDNGIGIANSQHLKTDNQKQHQSRGITNIKERIELLNSLYNMTISMKTTSPIYNDKTGTQIDITIPLKNVNYNG